jgi:hypothetical protein
VRPRNPSIAPQNFLRNVSGRSLSRSFTNFELKKPETASKNFSVSHHRPEH